MADEHYGQKEPMENESMAHTLDAQARAIWPQERHLLRQIIQGSECDVLDVGCGTGEISSRIIQEFAPRRVVGLDLSDVNLERARIRFPEREYPALTFQQGNAANMPFADDEFDVAICRHMLQAVPEPGKVIREMLRVVKPGGKVYFLAEDYGMIFFHPTEYDTDTFWREYAGAAAQRAGSNLRQGRTMPVVLQSLRCTGITVDYLSIDSLRVPRDLLAKIFIHWKEGFDEWISEYSGHPLEDVRARFDDIIRCAGSEHGYAAWLIPCISAHVTPESKLV